MHSELLSVLECGNASIKIEVSGEDLKQFANFLIARGAEMAKEQLNSQESYLSKKEVLEKFGVCDTTLWHWQRTGYLVPRKIGRKILYSKADVDELLTMKNGGRRYMASKMCAKDVKSVSLALNRLVSKGLILRNSIERNRVQFHEYKVPADILSKAREKITGGREKPDAPGEKMGATKIYTRYNKSIKAVKSPKAIEL